MLESTYKFSRWRGVNKNKNKIVQMKDNDVYVNPCFLMLVGSKTDSSNDNP
jgi:hypothetical protein